VPRLVNSAPESPTDTGTADSPRAEYERLHEQYVRLQRDLATRSLRISLARLITFVVAVVLAIWAMESGALVAWTLAGATIPAFITLVAIHARVRRAEWHRISAARPRHTRSCAAGQKLDAAARVASSG
jgi:hypothetical protein